MLGVVGVRSLSAPDLDGVADRDVFADEVGGALFVGIRRDGEFSHSEPN